MNGLDNKSESTRRLVQKTILNFIDVSSVLHGLPNIIRSKRLFIKFLWLISSVASCCFCFIFIRESILDYISYKYITNINNIFEHPIQFPTVSFCSTKKGGFNQSLNELISNCIFNLEEECKYNSNNVFESYNDSKYNSCYRFNSGRNMKGESIKLLSSNVAGRSYGLQLEIKEENGLALFIHNSSKLPYSFEDYNNFNGDVTYLAKDLYTDIIIHKEYEIKLEEPYNNCIKDPLNFKGNKTLIKSIIKTNQSYRHQHCIYLCFDLNYIKDNKCDCKSKIGQIWNNCFTQTENSSKKNCTYEYRSNFYKENIIKKCQDYCPFECDSEKYVKSLSFRPYEKSEFKLKFYIYFSKTEYTFIEQIPKMNFTSLISNVGGIFGIFFGMSILSFIEIFEILFEIMMIFIEKYRNLK